MVKNYILEKLYKLKPSFFNTPLIKLYYRYKNSDVKVIYAKYESVSFSGSIKDRLAYFIFKDSLEKGLLKDNQTIVEVTSGNTGIAISALGKALGYEVKIIMPDWLSKERYDIMSLFGIDMEKVSKQQGGFLGSISKAKKCLESSDYFYTDQFCNLSNVDAHKETTAYEVFSQLEKINKTPTHFIAGVGTGGTVMGFLNYCLENDKKCHVHPLEPSNSPTLTTGGKKIGSHRIQGISDEFIPKIVCLESLDKIISVDDGDSIIMAQKLNRKGLSVGISSGANFIGAISAINEDKSESAVPVTVFCDSSFKYLSTDLVRDEPVKDNFLSKDIDIIYYEFLK